jgi:hypothetical protein
MTKVWGPMGWMTLHSISAAYPDKPTESDKKTLSDFMNAFGETITCIHCRQHFGSMFAGYKQNVPSWSNSKQDLFLAICRLHNTVNKRLDKPIPKTISECIASLKNATSYTSQTEFRNKYIEYLQRDWSIFGRGSSYQIVAFNAVKIMHKINEEYWNKKEVAYSALQITEADVLTYPNQPVTQKIVFGKLNLRNVRWSPRV